MYAQVEKSKENKSRAIAKSVTQKMGNERQSFEFVDNRPEAIAQKKLQEIGNNCPQAMQLKAFQNMASSSPQARHRQAVQSPAMAKNYFAQQQEPIQKSTVPEKYLQLKKETYTYRNSPPIQLMKVWRWMDANKPEDYISKLAETKPDDYKRLHSQLLQSNDIMKTIDEHGQGLLQKISPFVSLAVNPYSLSWGYDTSEGGVDTILKSAEHTIVFDVPNEFLYPGLTKLSQSETEILALLPPGDTLKNYIAKQGEGMEARELIQSNRWKGMSAQVRRSELIKINPEFTKLNVKLLEKRDERGRFAVHEEVVTSPCKASSSSQVPLDFNQLSESMQSRVINLAAANWPGGEAKFKVGLSNKEQWAIEFLNSTISDNEEDIRKYL